MKLFNPPATLVHTLKHQPTLALLLYVIIGLVGMGASLVLDWVPPLKLLVIFLSGFVLGFCGDLLITRTFQTLAHLIHPRSHSS